MLHGRHAEQATLDGLLDRARRQGSAALVVRGEAGIGKSALLTYAADHAEHAEQAGGFRVLRAVGVESEAELAFAALHQLLWPLHEGIEELPGPQAAALRGAFGLAPVPVEGHNRFLVAVAVLTLLAEAAERQPLLCLIDDAHWVDGPSADALLFVARRLAAEGIVVLFAARGTETFTAQGIPELSVGGLDADAAAALLTERNPVGLTPDVIESLVERTRGNPLALLEVPPLLEPAQLAGRAALPDVLPIGAGLERAYLARVRRLPPAARTLVNVVAADDFPELSTVLRATGADADALGEVERAELVHVDGNRIEFRHPLMRSAVYRSMPFAERRAAHHALADSLDGQATDRRAWHLAAAAGGPDETVARALEDSAERTRRRSGYAAAATALQRAAELSEVTEARVRRLILAADSAWLAGQVRRAQELVDQAEPLVTGVRERVEIARLRGSFQLRTGVPARAADIFVDGAMLAAGHDPVQALEMLMFAGDAAGWAGDPPRVVGVAARAAELPMPDDDRARFAVHMLTGVSDLLQGDVVRGMGRLRVADELAAAFDEPNYLLWASITEVYIGRSDARQRIPRAVARARELGAVGILPYALEFSAIILAGAGHVTEAVTQASEGLQLARDTGQETAAGNLLAALAMATALQGQEQDCRRYAEEALAGATPRRLGLAIGFTNHALALLDLGLGRPAEALERLLSIRSAGPGDGHPLVAANSVPDLVEAAVRADRGDVAEQVVSELASAGPSRALAHCRGLLGDPDEAAACFEEALRLVEAPLPFLRARIELAYGEHLRRARRRSAARGHLRVALEAFERLGLTPWAERARGELRATGETARKRDPSAVNQLTPQELQIASFAGRGASNPEIAAQLFLSRRTVEYHLGKVFHKLGVSSRTELAALQLN